MATNDIKILKKDSEGIWTEFDLTAEASKVVGFNESVAPVMVSVLSESLAIAYSVALG